MNSGRTRDIGADKVCCGARFHFASLSREAGTVQKRLSAAGIDGESQTSSHGLI